MIDDFNTALTLFITNTQLNRFYLEIIILTLYSAFILTRTFPFLLALGIQPRHFYGLPGIFFAPFIHLNFNHLFFNTIPLIVLSDFILMNGLDYFLTVSLSITVMSGFLIWCFAKPGIHLGASAVITGYWALLVCNIYQQGTIMAIFLGVICFYYFAGIFLGVFPSRKGVSWEGHLFGLLAGITTSTFMT